MLDSFYLCKYINLRVSLGLDWILIGKILYNISVSCKLSCNECLKPGCIQVMGPRRDKEGSGAETKTRDRRENVS